MIKLTPGHLTLAHLRQIARGSDATDTRSGQLRCHRRLRANCCRLAAKGEPAYGINTGFGRLVSTHILADQLELLQLNLVLSHAVGVGEPMSRRSCVC